MGAAVSEPPTNTRFVNRATQIESRICKDSAFYFFLPPLGEGRGGASGEASGLPIP